MPPFKYNLIFFLILILVGPNKPESGRAGRGGQVQWVGKGLQGVPAWKSEVK